jgi:hypothetical protein
MTETPKTRIFSTQLPHVFARDFGNPSLEVASL